MTTTARHLPTTPWARGFLIPAPPVEYETTHLLFVRQAAEIANHIIRPAMEATLACLAREGGGGRIEERCADDRHSLRLIPWMAVEDEDGNDAGTASRLDRDPYLQLDIDVATRRVDVWSGDVGNRQDPSRNMLAWPLSDITGPSVTSRVTDLLRGDTRPVTPCS